MSEILPTSSFSSPFLSDVLFSSHIFYSILLYKENNIYLELSFISGFLGGSLIENLPACAGSLGWEDPLEERMATHSSILAWEIPWTKEPGRLQYMESQTSQTQLSD